MGQNSVPRIDWTGIYFEPWQILAQNNPKLGQDRDFTGNFFRLKKWETIQDKDQI